MVQILQRTCKNTTISRLEWNLERYRGCGSGVDLLLYNLRPNFGFRFLGLGSPVSGF